MYKGKKSASEILRQKAEEQLNTSTPRRGAQDKLLSVSSKTALPLSEIEMMKLIHELEVHQIELELQNDELRHAKATAELATNKYTDLYDFAPTGYFTLSRLGDIIELNLTGAKMLGKERSKLINSRFGFFISSDTLSVFNLFVEKMFESKSQESCDVTLIKGGNITTYVILTGTATHNKECCNMSMVDITERREMEKALQESEDNLRTLFNAMTDAVFEMDYDGRYISIAPTSPDLMFRPPDMIVGKTLHEVFPKPEADKFLEFVRRCLDENITSTIEYPLIIKDKTIWFEGSATPKTKNTVLFIARDVTDRKQAKEEIKSKNKELEELNAQKDKFFSIIAHDLKSPFNSIVGFSKLLVEKVRVKDYDSVSKYAGIIEQSSNRAMDLLMNLMEWSRSQTGRMEFNPEYIEMVSLINETALLFDDIAAQKTISIVSDLPANAHVYADKAMISTVLRNLISNAVKFTYPGGKIIISAQENQNELKVSVSDNGVGISKSRLEKLFRLDENYSTSGTNNEKGTGLGLILCKDFVEKHEGNIWAKSEVGKGSTFYFTVPI